MQQAIDIIENIFLADFRPVACPAAFQNEICYAVLARVLAFFAVKKRRLVDGFLFVIVQREALSFFHKFQVWQLICYHNGKAFSISYARMQITRFFVSGSRK